MKVTLSCYHAMTMDIKDVVKGIKESTRGIPSSARYSKKKKAVFILCSDGKEIKADDLTDNEIKLVKALSKVERLYDIVDQERRSMMKLY